MEIYHNNGDNLSIVIYNGCIDLITIGLNSILDYLPWTQSTYMRDICLCIFRRVAPHLLAFPQQTTKQMSQEQKGQEKKSNRK